MTMLPEAAQRDGQVVYFNNQPYELMTREQVTEFARKTRAWDVTWAPDQGAPSPFDIEIGGFELGSGVSFAPIPGTYDEADGWDFAGGRAASWPRHSTCEAFTAADSRGWIVDLGDYTYVLKGRYAVRYHIAAGFGGENAILDFHNFGTDISVAGRPAVYDGKVYVPLRSGDAVTPLASPQFRADANVTGTGTSATIAAPAGLTDDDIMIACIAINQAATPVTPPAGWNTIYNPGSLAAPGNATFWKRAASESGTYQFSWSGAAAYIGYIAAYSGALTTGTPIEAGIATGALSGTDHKVSNTVGGDLRRVVSFFGTTSAVTHSPDGAENEREDLSATISLAVYDTEENSGPFTHDTTASAGSVGIGAFATLIPAGESGQNFHVLDAQADPTTGEQTLVISGTPTTGTWTATFDDGVTSTTTAVIAIDATAADVQTALRAIPGLEKVTVARSGASPNWTYTVTMTAAPTALATGNVPEFTAADTFDVGVVTPGTTTTGAGDTWRLGPTYATCFMIWREALVRGYSNLVSQAQTDPLTLSSWGADYEVGDDTYPITDLAVYGADLIVGKQDGPWIFNQSFKADSAIPELRHLTSARNCIGMEYVQGYLLIPHRGGLIRWRRGAWQFVGAQEDDLLEGALSRGWGGITGITAHGKRTYLTIEDLFYQTGVIASLSPGGNRAGGLVPHMHHRPSGAGLEAARVISVPTELWGEGFTSIANVAGGGADWQNPSGALVLDMTETNLEPNGDFETNVDTWVTENANGADPGAATGITLESSTDQAKLGSRSAKVVTPGLVADEGFVKLNYEVIPILPSTTYTYSGYLHGPLGETFEAVLQEWDVPISGFTVLATHTASLTGTGNWQRFDISFTTTASTNYLQPRVRRSGAPAAGTFYVDALTLNRGNYAHVTDAGAGVDAIEFLNPDGMVIPAGNTIAGIRIRVHCRKVDSDAAVASIVDSSIQLVVGGVPVGDNKADTLTQWPTGFAVRGYGSASDLWGTTLVPADIGPNFGVRITPNITDGQAQIDYVHLALAYVTPRGEPRSYLMTLRLASDRQTCTPHLYELGRSGLPPANDPNIDHHVSNAELRTSRRYEPHRRVQKTYSEYEAYFNLEPESNIPGVELWASIDDGAEFQLLDADGAAATLTASGDQRVFFPRTSAAVGKYVQIRARVPALAGDEDPVDVQMRDGVIRGVYDPRSVELGTAYLILRSGGMLADGTVDTRTLAQKRLDLERLVGGNGALPTAIVPVRDPYGRTGYIKVVSVAVQDFAFKGDLQQPVLVATVGLLSRAYA